MESEMSTEASTPIAGKPYVAWAAQEDSQTASEQDGNLSEEHVKERFKALSENTKMLFEKLETELERHYIGSVSEILEWGAHLSKTLETPDLVDLFTKWMFFRRPKPEVDLNGIDLEEFRNLLTAANWKSKNKSYDRVFDLMWNTRSDGRSTFMLKQLNDNFLAVTINPRCLTPRDLECESLEAYDIVESNVVNILGLRYQTKIAVKEMIIAPFGPILFCTHPKDTRFPWMDSGYVLVLEIREDGKAGDFHFVYRFAGDDMSTLAHKDRKSWVSAEAEDSNINFKTVLCGQGPFTVGKVKPTFGLKFFGCRDLDSLRWMLECTQHKEPWTVLPPHNFDAQDPFELDSLSTSRPDIVMSGIRESRKGREIVGLFDDQLRLNSRSNESAAKYTV